MSRIDMIAPSTTTPATIMTRLSSLPSEGPAGSPTWLLSMSVLMAGSSSSWSQVERRQGRRHRRPHIGLLLECWPPGVGTAAQVVADLPAQPEGDVGGGEEGD